MSYLERAEKDGFANIFGADGKQKITYVTSYNFSESYEKPEEKVRAEFWAELIYAYEYPANRIKIEVAIPDRLPTDRADIVIFSDDECKRPYAIVECKRDGVTDAEFNQAIEQGVGNASWVKLRADYVVIIAGGTRRILDVSEKFGAFEREQNIIADLPKAYGKPQEFRFYKGGVNEKGLKAFDIEPVDKEVLISAIKKCHQTLWGGGRLSPPTAFGELCKLIFVKISDEQKPRKTGDPYQFQIKTHEPPSKLAERISALYEEQKKKDPEVFTESIKVDDRVLRTVVTHLESINLNKTDLDVKGLAFEQFMDGFFKGDFGQYFTPRQIIQFIVRMMEPAPDWDVLDPACGSGGFLLHALDFVRELASEYYDKVKQPVEHKEFWHNFASKHLYGIEINDEIARVAKMNMIVHDDGHTNVISNDSLDSIEKMHDHNRGFEKDKFDLILTNPPFGSTINAASKPYLSTFTLGRVFEKNGKFKTRSNQSSEVLFIERIWEFLKPGTGKAAVILPDGILTNSSMQYVRDFILEKFQLLAVVSLPQAAFAHFGAGVKASIIFLRKRKIDEVISDEESIFMAAPELIGYDSVGRKTESQFEEIILQYRKFQEERDFGVAFTDYTPSLYSYQRLKDIIEYGIYCNPYSSYLKGLFEHFRTNKWYAGHLEEFVDVNPQTNKSSLSDESVVTFVPMAAVSEKLNHAEYETRIYGEVKSGFTVFQRNDLLWAKITPCMQNGKSFLANDMPTEIGIGSTEFHVLRQKSNRIHMPYLWILLSEQHVLEAAQGMFSGSAGQQRVPETFLKKFPIVLPPIEVQQMLSDEVFKAQTQAKLLRDEAELVLSESIKQFEQEILRA